MDLKLLTRFRQSPRDLKLFVMVSFIIGLSFSLMDSTFNNFLKETFHLTGLQRSLLEVPREGPGVLIIFITAGLSFLCSRRLGAVALLLAALGSFLLGFQSSTYLIMTFWLFTYSLGMHLMMPVQSTIGMELAAPGKFAARLGQLNSVRNLATILGSAVVFVGFKYLGFTFSHTFTLITIGFLAAAGLMLMMQRQKPISRDVYLKLKKDYGLYYALVVLLGMRRQIFITFAPWVIVSVFDQPTQTLATLMTLGGVIGIVFQPFLGRVIDKYGERLVLATEGIITIFLCLGYGFSKDFLPATLAFYAVCVIYMLDQMAISVGMARSTYMKKIAHRPEDVQPALTAGIALDHVFSISIALIGGLIWNTFGFQWVFVMGAVVSLINFFVARRIKVPAV